MGLLPVISGSDPLITAILAVNLALGEISRSKVPDLRAPVRDCRTCTAIHCPLKDTPAFKYLYDDPVLEEICSHYWR